MEIAYSGDAFHTYMVISSEEWGENEDEEKMMSNQSAQVLLPFQVQRLNDRKNYCYDISGRMEFRSYIERKQADRSMIKSVIRFIAGLDQAVEEYLLMPDGLLLQPECLYLEMPEENLRAAYIPGRKEDFSKQLKELTAWLLENTYHEDREGVLLAYELYKSVQQENFLPGRLKELLKEEKKENVQGELDMETNKTFVEEASDKGQQREEVDADSKEPASKKLIQGKKAIAWKILSGIAVGAAVVSYICGWTGKLLQTAGMTVSAEWVTAVFILGAGISVLYRLLSRRTGPKEVNVEKRDPDHHDLFEGGGVYAFTDETGDDIWNTDENKTILLSRSENQIRLLSLDKKIAPDLVLDRFPCMVGSLQAEDIYVIPVRGISRKHARIEKTEKGIYLMDLNSTNGTRINGEELKKNEKRRLMAEDIVEFAGVRYMFC